MDRFVVNSYKGVVPNWCFAEVGKLFFKIRSDHVSMSSLVTGSSIPKEATSSELRLPFQRRFMSWPVREIKNTKNSFHFPLLWGSRYRYIHFALRARLKLCKSSIFRRPSAKSSVISVLLTLSWLPSYRNLKKTICYFFKVMVRYFQSWCKLSKSSTFLLAYQVNFFFLLLIFVLFCWPTQPIILKCEE